MAAWETKSCAKKNQLEIMTLALARVKKPLIALTAYYEQITSTPKQKYKYNDCLLDSFAVKCSMDILLY